MIHAPPPYRTAGPVQKLLALAAGAVLLLVGLVFSVAILAVALAAGLATWGWFWWKTRKLRKAMREHPPGGQVIEGEVVVVDETDSARIAQDPLDGPGRQA